MSPIYNSQTFLIQFGLVKLVELHHQNKSNWPNDDDDYHDHQDVLSQIRQLDYLLSKAQDIKIADRWSLSFLNHQQKIFKKFPQIFWNIFRESFEDDFEDIKDLISAKTLFAVDDAITQVFNSLCIISINMKALPEEKQMIQINIICI